MRTRQFHHRQRLFDKTFESLNGRSELIILSRKETTFDWYPGVEWEIKPPLKANLPRDKGVVRVFWAEPVFYIIMIGGPDSVEAAAVRTKYLDSFKIIKNR